MNSVTLALKSDSKALVGKKLLFQVARTTVISKIETSHGDVLIQCCEGPVSSFYQLWTINSLLTACKTVGPCSLSSIAI